MDSRLRGNDESTSLGEEARERVDGDGEGGEVDVEDDVFDGGDEEFAARAADDEDVVAGCGDDAGDLAEGLAGGGEDGEADELVVVVFARRGLREGGLGDEQVGAARFGRGFTGGDAVQCEGGRAPAATDAADGVLGVPEADCEPGRQEALGRERLDAEFAADAPGAEDAGDGDEPVRYVVAAG